MKKRQAILLTALTVASLVLGLLISRRLWFRLDLTASRAFTISPVSRNLYAEISEQVRITYFISDKLRSLHPMPGEIEDLLREYAARSHGRITVSFKDPVKTNMAETVEQLGIRGQSLETVEQDQASVAMVYSGILIEYLDRVEVLPLVFSLETLEYDLTSRIRSMVRDVPREAGILVGDSARNLQQDYSWLSQVLERAGYRVRNIAPGEEISPALPVLAVLGGAGELDDWDLYRIDHYIRSGGKVLFALEAVDINIDYGPRASAIEDKGLLAMLSSYGATLQPSLVMDLSCQAVSVQTQAEGGFTLIRRVNYPLWVAALGQFAAPNHPASAGFAGADLFWASPLELGPPEGIEGTALFSTTPDAWLQTRNFYLDPNQSYYFTMEQEETAGQKILAAALSGKFPSWFEGLPKPVREGRDGELPDPPSRAAESRIVVIGDTDFATNEGIQRVQNPRNLEFVVKALDWLGNDDDISSIRSREVSTGRLEKIADPERRVLHMAQVRIINVFVIPALVILLGVLVTMRRRKMLAPEGGRKTA